MNELDAGQRPAARRRAGGVAAFAPIDEEGDEPAIGMAREAEHAPAEPAAIGKLPTTLADRAWCRSDMTAARHDVVEVDAGHRPVIEALAGQVAKLAAAIGGGLTGITGEEIGR